MRVATPIIFTPDYYELVEPAGSLPTIKQAGAFKAGTKGGETIPEFLAYAERIVTVPGKVGRNAFVNAHLHEDLHSRGIFDICLAGAVTSMCIDATGRSAFEHGDGVHILSDCTAARTAFEESFYCETVFPPYADGIDSNAVLAGFRCSVRTQPCATQFPEHRRSERPLPIHRPRRDFRRGTAWCGLAVADRDGAASADIPRHPGGRDKARATGTDATHGCLR